MEEYTPLNALEYIIENILMNIYPNATVVSKISLINPVTAALAETVIFKIETDKVLLVELHISRTSVVV